MQTTRRALWAIAVALLLGTAACGARKQSPPAQPQTPPSLSTLPDPGYTALRVGIAPNYPPLTFKQDGRIRGVEVDLARQLSRDTGIRTTVVEVAWGDLIPALLDGRIDVIMSGMSMTKERAEKVAFAQPYMRVGQMCLIRAEDIARLASPSVLFEGRWRVGFMNKTTGELFAREQLHHSTLVGFDSIDAGTAALHAKKIDYFIHDAPTIWRITTDPVSRDDRLLGLFQPLTEEYLAWAVRRSDKALRRFLSQVIARWKEDGTLREILDRWIRVRLEIRPPSAPAGEAGGIP